MKRWVVGGVIVVASLAFVSGYAWWREPMSEANLEREAREWLVRDLNFDSPLAGVSLTDVRDVDLAIRDGVLNSEVSVRRSPFPPHRTWAGDERLTPTGTYRGKLTGHVMPSGPSLTFGVPPIVPPSRHPDNVRVVSDAQSAGDGWAERLWRMDSVDELVNGLFDAWLESRHRAEDGRRVLSYQAHRDWENRLAALLAARAMRMRGDFEAASRSLMDSGFEEGRKGEETWTRRVAQERRLCAEKSRRR